MYTFHPALSIRVADLTPVPNKGKENNGYDLSKGQRAFPDPHPHPCPLR